VAPLPMAVRDLRRFEEKPRALLITEIQGLESLFAATAKDSTDRPKLARRLAYEYIALVRVAVRDGERSGDKLEKDKANKIRLAAGGAAIRYYTLLLQQYPRWCANTSAVDPTASTSCGDESAYYAALHYEQLQRLDEARKTYLELIQGWPDSKYVPLAYMAFGELFLEEAQHDRSKLELAEQSFAMVVKFPYPDNPAQGWAVYRLGQVYMRKDNLEQARSHLARAARHAETAGDTELGERVRHDEEKLRELEHWRAQ
jgi:tetratricopeptide (TPR) repeat protein